MTDTHHHRGDDATMTDLVNGGVPPIVAAALTGGVLHMQGAAILGDVEAFLARFVAYPSEAARVAHVLWIAHTWFMDAWDSTPRIAFLSPEPGSGKTRALEVTEPLVPRPVHAVNATPAYLFRKVSDEAGPPTILYDEIDTVFGPKAKDNEDIRGMLNAGHRKGAIAGRCVVRGKIVETEELPAYCAVALAGLDDLPDTIMTRSVVVRMRRRAPDERVEPWRAPGQRRRGPTRSRDRLADWADGRRAAAIDAGPTCRTASRTATPTCGRRCSRSPTWPAATGPSAPVLRLLRLLRQSAGQRGQPRASLLLPTCAPSSATPTGCHRDHPRAAPRPRRVPVGRPARQAARRPRAGPPAAPSTASSPRRSASGRAPSAATTPPTCGTRGAGICPPSMFRMFRSLRGICTQGRPPLTPSNNIGYVRNTRNIRNI